MLSSRFLCRNTSIGQSNNLSCGSQTFVSSTPQMPAAAMGTKPSALSNTSATSVAPVRVSLPPPQTSTPQEPSTAPSLASYSAVPFPASTVLPPLQPQSIQSSIPSTPQPPQQQPLQLQPTAFVDGTGDAMDDRLRHRETVLTLYPFTRNQVGAGFPAFAINAITRPALNIFFSASRLRSFPLQPMRC